MTRIFRHYHRLGKVEDEVNPNSLEGKSSEVIHTLFRTSNLPEPCLFNSSFCKKPCPKKPEDYCGVRVFLGKYGIDYQERFLR